MKINYIIATYAGISDKRNYGNINDTLRIHLSHLVKYSHSLDRITISKALVEHGKKTWDGYYNIEDIVKQIKCPVVIEEVVNHGYSNGQYMRCYEKVKGQFDYYILVEDDYIPCTDDFDTKLQIYYNKKFPNNIGKLANFTTTDRGNIPLHYDGVIMVSDLTFQKLYSNPHFKNNPTTFFNINVLNGTHHPYFKSSWSKGGREQVVFSYLFTLSNIKIENMLDDYTFRYWDDTSECITIFNKQSSHIYDITKNECDSKLLKQELFIPIQLSPYYIKNEYQCIKYHQDHKTNTQSQKTCVLILSNHRSGSSVLTGLLHLCGIDIGKSRSHHKDIYNPKGYFENEQILHLNCTTLSKNKSSWKDVSNFSSNWEYDIQKETDKLKNIITTNYDGNFICIKDPRILFLFPLYEKVLTELNIDIKIIYIHRNYEAIAKSLHRVHNLPIHIGKALCNKYESCFNNIQKKHKRMELQHGEIIQQPLHVMNKISNFLDYKCFSPYINSFVDKTLVHY